jgi:hypothetical protein
MKSMAGGGGYRWGAAFLPVVIAICHNTACSTLADASTSD